jgi:hypothetical protein
MCAHVLCSPDPADLTATAAPHLSQLVSTVLTIALLGGAAWLYFQYGGSDASSSSSSSSRNGQNRGKRSSADDADDPLAEARRIMDKYK